LPVNRGEKRTDFHANIARGARLVGNRYPTADRVGLWNPVLGRNVYVLERRIVKEKKIRVKASYRWRQCKSCRVADSLSILVETQEDPHRFCSQPVGGMQRECRRFSATGQNEFPDMVVEIVGNGEA